MNFQPTQEEVDAAKGVINNGPSDLDSTALALSGSGWEQAQLTALRARLLDELPLDRIIFSEFQPSKNDQSEC
jgi:hypothetical protein